MVKINVTRLNEIANNFNTCFEDINLSISYLNDTKLASNINMKRLINNSIRNCISSIFINTEEYLASILNKSDVLVSNEEFKECLLSAKQENLIASEFADCILENIAIRDMLFCGYNQPSTEYLIEFYQDNREILLSQIEFIKNLVKR